MSVVEMLPRQLPNGMVTEVMLSPVGFVVVVWRTEGRDDGFMVAVPDKSEARLLLCVIADGLERRTGPTCARS